MAVCGQEAAGQEQQVCERRDGYSHAWLGTVGGEAGGNEVQAVMKLGPRRGLCPLRLLSPF